MLAVPRPAHRHRRAGPHQRSAVARRGHPAHYRLEKQDAGWKIYDVNVPWVWLVENYKTQFAARSVPVVSTV